VNTEARLLLQAGFRFLTTSCLRSADGSRPPALKVNWKLPAAGWSHPAACYRRSGV